MKGIIPIGCDHAGVDLKNAIIDHLSKKGYELNNVGTDTTDSIDYPDYGHPVAEIVEKDSNLLGIVICGSGNGINMTVNKHKAIRSALCWTVEIAELARQHNNANIIALPARFISIEEGIKMVDVFLNTEFEGGRHDRRVQKIPC
jgi:ribose 5-phosphate isomerase B